MKTENLLILAGLLSMGTSQGAIFNISLAISFPQSTTLSGTVEVSDVPLVSTSSGTSGSSGTIHSFQLLNLELADSSVSKVFLPSELEGFSFELIETDFGTLEFFGRIPLPPGTIGLSGPHEVVDNFEWEDIGGLFTIPPVGMIDVTDLEFVADSAFPPASGAGVVGPSTIEDLFDDSVGDAFISELVLVPEPTSVALTCVGFIIGLGFRRRVQG